ncbi:5829_t:CDS:2 [Paraglomus occultum]|uniref:5829_t:CDS:1 n=1 Tax=Paraglomus occultum TaxID=144539 RepID=A0A9N9CA93_9GLOM|nr:5829_t:CDS:2 [Paraglomus occultum]
MVLYFTSTVVDPPAMVYMGKDKYESVCSFFRITLDLSFQNEELIKYGWNEDFHVDKLSSAHVYLRLQPDQTWDAIPSELLNDLAQLVKANSIEGNKMNNITVVYTPWYNLKKTAEMDVGQVKRINIASRDNKIINRLGKTKKELYPDLLAEKEAHNKELRKIARAEEMAKAKEELRQKQKFREEAAKKSYDSLFDESNMRSNQVYEENAQALEDDFM